MDRCGERFRQTGDATLTIGPAAEGGTTALSYRLSIEGTPLVAYSAEATYQVDSKGCVTGEWTDNYGRTRPTGGRVTVRIGSATEAVPRSKSDVRSTGSKRSICCR